ncbi:MAG TPA: c-type cytochrome [Longimicrobiales bacterium]|nr:c-type cytochrome [Longimicrobiales bacterium]
MRGMKWGAAVVVAVTLVACAKKDAGDDAAAADSAAAATTAAAPAPAAPTAGSPPAGATADMVTQGQQIFTSTGNCYTCHGPDAKGTALAPNLSDAEWLNISGTYDEIQGVVKNGVAQPKDPSHAAPMPAMGGAQLTDDQIKAVAAYVWSLGGGK